jgi:rRNA maturation endonuclease Nob1
MVEQSYLFLVAGILRGSVVTMGVLDRAKRASGLSSSKSQPYICLNCETRFNVQYHTCPVCGTYDVRRTEWVE